MRLGFGKKWGEWVVVGSAVEQDGIYPVGVGVACMEKLLVAAVEVLQRIYATHGETIFQSDDGEFVLLWTSAVDCDFVAWLEDRLEGILQLVGKALESGIVVGRGDGYEDALPVDAGRIGGREVTLVVAQVELHLFLAEIEKYATLMNDAGGKAPDGIVGGKFLLQAGEDVEAEYFLFRLDV